MVEAGLVKATLNDGQAGGFTSINEVTVAGHVFLRAFEGHAFAGSLIFGLEWASVGGAAREVLGAIFAT
jgi:hypothetical protein